jgi:hypothetical protein
MHEDARAGRGRNAHVARVTHAFFGEPAEEFGRISDFAARVRKRLAVLDGDELREALLIAHDQLVGLAQNLAALARLLRGPCGECVACGVDGGLRVIDARARDRGDRALGRRIDDIEALAVGGLAPFSADPEIGRDVGEKIFVHGLFLLVFLFVPA